MGHSTEAPVKSPPQRASLCECVCVDVRVCVCLREEISVLTDGALMRRDSLCGKDLSGSERVEDA